MLSAEFPEAAINHVYLFTTLKDLFVKLIYSSSNVFAASRPSQDRKITMWGHERYLLTG